jgi:hypothetical protein
MVSGMPGIQSQAHAHLDAWIGVFLRAYHYSYQPIVRFQWVCSFKILTLCALFFHFFLILTALSDNLLGWDNT